MWNSGNIAFKCPILPSRIVVTPQAYSDYVADWVAAGVRIIGGGGEVGPAHISELKVKLKQ